MTMRLAALAFVLLIGAPVLAAESDVGVVLMHGKWGLPGKFVGPLASALADKGYKVANIEMPWSKRREYDKDYDGCLAEVDAAVAKLKADGAKKIFVGGHSLGANLALAYGATRDGVAGLIALAPGHAPETTASRYADSVAKARAMVAEGRADETAGFDDLNQGQTRTVQMKARIYLSFFDPDGMAAMTKTAAKVKPGVPVFMAFGREDPWFARGRVLLFDKLPADAASRYVEVTGGHTETPSIAASDVIDWLKGLE